MKVKTEFALLKCVVVVAIDTARFQRRATIKGNVLNK